MKGLVSGRFYKWFQIVEHLLGINGDVGLDKTFGTQSFEDTISITALGDAEQSSHCYGQTVRKTGHCSEIKDTEFPLWCDSEVTGMWIRMQQPGASWTGKKKSLIQQTCVITLLDSSISDNA
jgi:hypothetical protein